MTECSGSGERSIPSAVVVSIGDVNGIGPEILLKYHRHYPRTALIVAGNRAAIDFWSEKLGIPYNFEVMESGDAVVPQPGVNTEQSGKLAVASISAAYTAARDRNLPLVTLPVSKHAISLTEEGFTGHTEYLARLDGKNPDTEVIMLLGGDQLKVVTLTRHIPLSTVPAALTTKRIVSQLRIVNNWFVRWRGRNPLFWVAGCNPHAGESGDIGTEEITVIRPALDELKKLGISVEGPFAADTMFVTGMEQNVDIFVSCYHDQGLTPMKMVHFSDGVNVTIGLSVVRTSVDHGTAFDIAGRGTADIRSFETAISWACSMHRP